MEKGRVMRLRITVMPRKGQIHIGKDVIRIIGSPDYVCLMQREDKQTIAIGSCGKQHPMSFKVPGRLFIDGGCGMRITSSRFIGHLIESNNLSMIENKVIEGKYDSEINAVIFPLKVT